MSDEIKDLTQLDRLIHEPARLAIIAVLSACQSADFKYLLNATGLTKGNLSSQLSKLEESGYITIRKGFQGKYTHTDCALTPEGRRMFITYLQQYEALMRRLNGEHDE